RTFGGGFRSRPCILASSLLFYSFKSLGKSLLRASQFQIFIFYPYAIAWASTNKFSRPDERPNQMLRVTRVFSKITFFSGNQRSVIIGHVPRNKLGTTVQRTPYGRDDHIAGTYKVGIDVFDLFQDRGTIIGHRE